MPPELEIVREWVELAAEGLEAARRLLKGNRPVARTGAFCCQQAVEKALKAFLEFRQGPPPRTHSLGELLDLAERIDRQFETLRDADWLTHFAVQARYPGDVPRPTAATAREALAAAERVFRFVLDRLPPEVLP
jgi:HEPN domain-containing protein